MGTLDAGVEGGGLIEVKRAHDDAQVGEGFVQVTDRPEALGNGHADVDHRHVGLVLTDGVEGGIVAVGHTNDRRCGSVTLDEEAHHVTPFVTVINQDGAQRRHRAGRRMWRRMPRRANTLTSPRVTCMGLP